MTERQKMKLKMQRRRLGIAEPPLDDMMGMEQASDLIDTYAAAEAALDLEPHRPPVDPHAHLPRVGTFLDLHADIDERLFITNTYDRRRAYAISDEDARERYFSECPGRYYVTDYMPEAPIVVAMCNQCGEEFAYKVPIPVVA